MEEEIPTHLIIRYLSNEATPTELEQLFNWVASNAENQKVFNEWLIDWNKTIPEEQPYNLSHGLETLNKKISQSEEKVQKRSFPIGFGRAAAVIGFFLTSLSVYFLFQYNASKDAITYTRSTTASGMKLTVTLSDGSIVKLNSNTVLRYPEEFNETNREVFLSGEAFFDIKKDSLHPFIIHTGKLTTRVLGTSFNINSNDDQVVVSVASGRVQVAQGDQALVLHPREKAAYSVRDNHIIRSETNLENELAWTNNALLFKDTPLNEAARMLEAWYGVKVFFQNKDLTRCFITGKYENLPLDRVLHAISFSTGMDYTINDNMITLSGKGCD